MCVHMHMSSLHHAINKTWITSDQNHQTSIEEVRWEETVLTTSQSDETLFTKARAIPNIDFLFMGYDISQGNPTSSRGLDPGFKSIGPLQAICRLATLYTVRGFIV